MVTGFMWKKSKTSDCAPFVRALIDLLFIEMNYLMNRFGHRRARIVTKLSFVNLG